MSRKSRDVCGNCGMMKPELLQPKVILECSNCKKQIVNTSIRNIFEDKIRQSERAKFKKLVEELKFTEFVHGGKVYRINYDELLKKIED